MAEIQWNGARLKRRVRDATALATDRTMAECVAGAKAIHDTYPPASAPGEPWANRIGALTGSIQILEGPTGFAGSDVDGDGNIVGRWGSLSEIALFVEIGTSTSGPDAVAREEAAGGSMWAVAAPEGPLMAARPALRPTADTEYPLLLPRIRAAMAGAEMP